MADIHCRHCGEPWDLDFLHEVSEYGMNYNQAKKSFAINGCGFREKIKCNFSIVDPDAMVKTIASQVLSDHPDDWLI